MHARTADQLYTFADLVRLLKVGEDRLRRMRDTGALLGPDHMIPGGGHKGARWSASRVEEIQRRWRTTL
jgi:hypothetical protein